VVCAACLSTRFLPAAGGDQAKGLAAAIAVVSCEGGASAEAFARALSQSIERDENGCDVLVTASSYAVARCGPNGAFAQSGSSVSRVSAGLEGRVAGVSWGTTFSRLSARRKEMSSMSGFWRAPSSVCLAATHC
jgi:hypothetical protein